MLVDWDWLAKVRVIDMSCMAQVEAASATVHSLQASNPLWLAPEVIVSAVLKHTREL